MIYVYRERAKERERERERELKNLEHLKTLVQMKLSNKSLGTKKKIRGVSHSKDISHPTNFHSMIFLN
jgi:hypothetical protein